MPEHAGRRHWLKRWARGSMRLGLGASVLSLDVPLAHGASVVAVRVWPASDYTRVTIELDNAVKFTHLLVDDPPRLVVDLDGIDVDSGLRELLAKVQADDPYIRQVRVGQFKPHVMRLAFDLKSAIAPQVFTLAPVAQYRHRLVLDLYPVVPIDPLAQLIQQMQRSGGTPPAAPGAAAGGGGTGNAARSDDPLQSIIRERGGPAEPAPPTSPMARDDAVGGPREREARGSVARRPQFSRIVTVAIDPGHGGEDPGAIGRGGTREKDVVLSIAQLLRERINAEPGMRAYLTRDDDYFVPLATRVAKARRVQADLFVSVHADAFVRPDARGASVYVLSERGATSTAARWLARQENQADRVGGVNFARRSRDVAKILLDLTTAAQIKDSSTLARTVLAELRGVGELHKPDVEQAGFAVLKAPDIPSILVETAFISNPLEEKRLVSRAYQTNLANAIFRGVRGYFVKNPPGPKSSGTT